MGMFDQLKNAMQMRSEAKRLQAEIERMTSEYTNAGITVTARGDMTVASIKISPEAWEAAKSDKRERFETMLFNVTNAALKNVKKMTQEYMAKLMQSGGMPGIFGK